MNFSRSTNGGRLGVRTGLPLSATSFDYRNNNVSTTNKILHSVVSAENYANSANFAVRISSSSPRVPEIQMINKFYGLIPKKFVINERLRPSTSVHLRQKGSTRPKTSKPANSSPQRTLESGDRSRLRRHSSVDETQREENGLISTGVPVLTRRISFERSLAKKQGSRAERTTADTDKNSTGLSALLNQRVIRIDLSHMRWEEEGQLDDQDQLPVAKELENIPPKSGILRKTISFDESVLKAHEIESSEDETGSGSSGLCKGHLLQVKERQSTARPTTAYQPAISWTAGKTTAERRSKLQKSFSIHPSFADNNASCDSWAGAESASDTYPDSMTRTGRRSFHVEPPPEVDTLVSKGTTKDAVKPIQRQKSQEASPKLSLPAKPLLPPPNPTPAPTTTPPLPTPILRPASERRKLFKKSVSLEPESKMGTKKAGGSGARPVLSRQNSAAVTKSEVHKAASSGSNPNPSRGKVGGGSRAVTVLKNKTLVELKRLRPKTAPSNNSGHGNSSGRGKVSEESPQENYTLRRRQPMKVRSDVTPGSVQPQSESRVVGVGQAESKKQVSIMDSKGQTKTTGKKSSSGGKPGGLVVAEEVPPRPISPPPPTTPLMPRRSFSLDEGTLLIYSTDAAQQTDSMENSMQNSKKREECLKIYERMKQGGCAVRLQTIFRGLMTPSEYRIFIAAAEKAAAAALVAAEGSVEKNDAETAPTQDCSHSVDTLGTEHGVTSGITVLAP